MDILVILLLCIMLYALPMAYVLEILTKKQRVSNKLYRLGICPKHLKPNDIHRSCGLGRGYSALCVDCVPEFERSEKAKLDKLVEYARTHFAN